MAGSGRAIAAYRWMTLALAGAVWVQCFGDARLAEFGWQFRHLDIWALSLSAASAALMLRLSLGLSASRHEGFVGAVAALNAAVIAVHLAPLASGAAAGAPAWRAAYLHLAGPALQIADAVLILGAFRRVGGALGGAALIAGTYVAWIELAVRPLNLGSDGTGGLPYGVLNGMGLASRLGVYGAAALAGLLAVPAFWALQRALRPAPPRSPRSATEEEDPPRMIAL